MHRFSSRRRIGPTWIFCAFGLLACTSKDPINGGVGGSGSVGSTANGSPASTGATSTGSTASGATSNSASTSGTNSASGGPASSSGNGGGSGSATSSGAGAGGAASAGAGGIADAGTDAGGGGPPAGTPVAVHGQLKVVGNKLQDQSGNLVQLKGVSSQWLNYESKTFPESKSGIQYARDHWKLSLLRAAMGTDARGGYLTTAPMSNQAGMLAKVNTIVQNAIDLGIYVIIDWHTQIAVEQQADAVAFFTAMAQKYGSYPNVIYEPFNEPHKAAPDYTWADIKPYHEAVVAAIRAQDPDNLIVLGTPRYSQDVDLASADPVAGTNLLYTLHFYACTHGQPLRTKGDTALANGVALFITEFGATPANGGTVMGNTNIVCESQTNDWFTWMSQNDISGASWKLDQCTDSSCILTSTAPVDGPWTDDVLTTDVGDTAVDGGLLGGGHGLFVVDWIRE